MKFGTDLEDLKDVYYKQVRSILEFSVPVWNSNITKQEIYDIERVQKCFMHIIMGDDYYNYQAALEKMNMETLNLWENYLKSDYGENGRRKFLFNCNGKISMGNSIIFFTVSARK